MRSDIWTKTPQLSTFFCLTINRFALELNLSSFFSCFSYKRKIQELLDEDDERGGAKMARYDSDGTDGIHEMTS